jgi:hypothetical protein
MSPERRAKLELLIERAADIRLRRELKLGLYVKREDVDRGQVERVVAVGRKMRTINTLAVTLAPITDPRRCEEILEGWAQAVCNSFASGNE